MRQRPGIADVGRQVQTLLSLNTMRRCSIVLLVSAVLLTPAVASATPSAPSAPAPTAWPNVAPKLLPVTAPKVRPALPPKIGAKPVAPAALDAPDVPAINQATAFVARLAPKPGFAYDVADYHALDAPAKAVLDTFAKVRNHVLRVAGENGVGERVLADNPAIDPRHVTAELNAALKEHGYSASDAANLLRAAAQKRSIGALMKAVLVRSAELWETKGSEDGWKAAVKLKAPPPVVHDRETEPQRPTDYELLLVARAKAEWERAPRAIGWGPDRKQLAQTGFDRAFTYERWMAFRTAWLRDADEHRAYVDLTLGVARHR